MSEKVRNKQKRKPILLKGGENPVFMSLQKNGVQIVQRIENRSGIKLMKTSKGVYFVIEIPPEGCLKLAYLSLRKVVGTVLKSLRQAQKKRVEEISLDELLSETRKKETKETELEEVPFE